MVKSGLSEIEDVLGKVFFFRHKNSHHLSPLWCTRLRLDNKGLISGWVENGHWNMIYYVNEKRLHIVDVNKNIYAELLWSGNAYDGTDYNDIIRQAEQRMINGEPSESL